MEKQQSESIPSGMSVTAHPPPPAPVNLVFSSYGVLAVISRIFSNKGCDTPNDTR